MPLATNSIETKRETTSLETNQATRLADQTDKRAHPFKFYNHSLDSSGYCSLHKLHFFHVNDLYYLLSNTKRSPRIVSHLQRLLVCASGYPALWDFVPDCATVFLDRKVSVVRLSCKNSTNSTDKLNLLKVTFYFRNTQQIMLHGFDFP